MQESMRDIDFSRWGFPAGNKMGLLQNVSFAAVLFLLFESVLGCF